VQVVEQDADLVKALQAVVQRLQATNQVVVRRGDGLAWLRGLPAASVDLVFLDPPFDANAFESALTAARPSLRTTGWLYLEAPAAWREDALAPLGYSLYRYLKAGAVHAHLLQPLV
jgi:16S rRNA G966 N2-methylase RsmD